jgi:hypothetical protein
LDAREGIAIGTATDPYQPAEGRFRITRRCLEVLAAAANPCSITTKGTLIVRDLDVLQSLTAVTQVSVHMSLITRDRDLWRRIEPGAPSPENRLHTSSRACVRQASPRHGLHAAGTAWLLLIDQSNWQELFVPLPNMAQTVSWQVRYDLHQA